MNIMLLKNVYSLYAVLYYPPYILILATFIALITGLRYKNLSMLHINFLIYTRTVETVVRWQFAARLETAWRQGHF